MPTPQLLKLQILRDLVEIDRTDGWWQATGQAAAFRLLPGVEGLPKGWLRLTVPVQAPRNASVVPSFKVDTGAGFHPLRVVLPRRLGDGYWTLMVHVPPGAIAISMSAPVAQGPFRLGAVQARSTNRPLVGARLAFSLGQRWLREPQNFKELASSMQAAWRDKGWAGLRQALGQTMLGNGPVTAVPVILATNRYQQWIAGHEAAEPLTWSEPSSLSILIPVANPEAAQMLAKTLVSLQSQPGLHWDCRIGFAPSAEMAAAKLESLLTPRITHQVLKTAERGAMLAALAAGAKGEVMLVLDPGDQLLPESLAVLASVPEADVIHGDEDRIEPSGIRSRPSLKPEWSPELLEAYNYFGRPTALRRVAVEAIGGFTPGLGAGAEWDLHLRLTTAAARITRLPHIFCHRPAGTDGDRPPADQPAAAELRSVLAAHWQRQGIAATVTTQPDGTQRATWPIAAPPLVSVVIPNKDQPVLLEQCLRGLLEETRYPNFEIIVVDSGSSDPATLALYARLEAAGAIRVMPFLAPFNYSAACNAGARAARGTLLLFLNNDIAVTRPDWLEELVRYALRPGVGVVGTMLVYPDGRLQHAGVTIGMHLCGLLFRLAPKVDWGPIGSPMTPRTVSAIMGACQMVRREVFALVGGFDESFIMANSDVALCLAAWAGGWRTAYTPFAKLVHHEGASRGHRNPVEDLTRTTHDLRRFGYTEDPFFHPGLDADSNIPRLRVAGELGNAASLKREMRRHDAGMANPVPIDLCNDAEVAEAVGLSTSTLFWPPVLHEAIGNRAAAARWCLNLLRRRPDLRRRFPDALSAGGDGAFARWLDSEGGPHFGLPATAVALVLEALAAGLSARARQVVLVQGGLAGDLVLAFLPPGRASLLSFLLRRDGLTLPLEEIWWLVLECAEDPGRELLLSYQFNPGWQSLFPDGLTIFGQDSMAAWFRTTYRSEGSWTNPAHWPKTLTPAEQIQMSWNSRIHWQQQHPNPFASPAAAQTLLNWLASPAAGLGTPELAWLAAHSVALLAEALATPGLTVIGHFGYPSGLRTSSLSVVQGLRKVGYTVPLRDVPVDADHDLPQHAAFSGFELHNTTLLHIQPEPFFSQAYARAGLQPRRKRTHRIGYWYWELDSVPAAWAGAVDQTDELWTATRFVGDALRSRFDVPVFEFMPGVELPPFTRRSTMQFGIPPGQFTFLFTFHMMSIMERKNPLGLIRAFRQAFAPTEPVMLILKTSFGEKHPTLIADLHAAAAEAGGKIMIIDRVFTMDETISLMEACDSYISLHRSEGLGLTMAEAMLLAKPVIGTRYSGNLSFMNDSNSLLVDQMLIEISKPTPPYDIGLRWANPSEAHAAQLMRRVWENQDFAAALGARAQTDLQATLSMDAAGRRMAERLAAIHSKGQ